MKTEAEIIAAMGGSNEPPVIQEEPTVIPVGTDPGNPGDTPATEPAAQGAGDAPKQVLPHEIFGEDFKDKDWAHVKSVLDERNEKLTTLEKEKAELAARQPDYADPEVAEYNAWIKNGGIKNHNIFTRVKNAGAEMSDIDAVITQRVLENPAFIGSEDLLKEEILSELPIVSTAENPLTEAQIKFNQAKITDKAIKAREYLKTQQDKLQVPVAPAAVDNSAVIAKRKENWSAATDQMFSKIKSVPLHTVVKKDGGKEEFVKVLDYQVPENLVPQYKERLVTLFSNYGDVDENTLKQLHGEFQKGFISENYPYMLAQALEQQRTQLEEEYDKKYGGGLTPKPPGGVGNTVTTDVVQGAKEHFKN